METVPHVVLEYDKWSDCALVALTDDAHSAVRGGTDMPYLVTSGYHRESRTWARATPFGDITRAKVVFEHRVGRDYAPTKAGSTMTRSSPAAGAAAISPGCWRSRLTTLSPRRRRTSIPRSVKLRMSGTVSSSMDGGRWSIPSA